MISEPQTIVGDDFTIFVDGKDVTISGTVNVHIDSDCIQTVHGDLKTVIEGDWSVDVKGDTVLRSLGDAFYYGKTVNLNYKKPVYVYLDPSTGNIRPGT